MAQWIDFKQLRSRLSFADVLKHYGVTIKSKGDQAQVFCPLPTHKGERRSPSFSINLRKGIWQCFGCGAKGNVLDLAVRMEGLSPDQPNHVKVVALRLRDLFQIEGVVKARESSNTPPPVSTKPPERRPRSMPSPQRAPALPSTPDATQPLPGVINEPLDFELKGLQANHPYLLDRGFTAKTIAHFGLGYCARGLMAGRIVIPLHDASSRLIGYAGRIVEDAAINAECPKYKFPPRRERQGVIHEFHKSHVLYNGNRIKGTVDHLIVVEGFASVWWLHQAGIENVVALMGLSCSPEQAAIIVAKTNLTSRITICPDGDDAGVRCAQSIFMALAAQRWVRWVRLLDGHQPTDCQPNELMMYVVRI